MSVPHLIQCQSRMISKQFHTFYHDQLVQAIDSYIRTELQNFHALPWSKQVTEKLMGFCKGGKLVRGTTFVEATHLLSNTLPAKLKLTDPAILAIGVAIELFGSALLIHDDIIDRDTLRRGKATIHTQFAEWATEHGRPSPQHDGNSAAIVLGDILLFLANRAIISQTDPALDITTIKTILQQFSRESLFTAFGELADSIGTPDQEQLSEEGILELYRTKTAHYTFCMPLTMAAIASKQSAEQVALWDTIGQHLGVLFQIKDDELGLFGNPDVTGKAVGADIRENKRTLYFLLTRNALLKANQTKKLELLEKAYGNPEITQTDILAVSKLIEDTGTRLALQNRMRTVATTTTNMLQSLEPSEPLRQWFSKLVEFTIARTK